MKNKKDIIIFTILGIVFITGIILIYISNNLDNNNNNELVTDNVKFFISLIGEDEMTVYKDDTFIDPGYNASNNLGENLNSEVIISGEVDTRIIGEYKINYSLGNVTKERIISVVERPVDHTYIHLTGERIIYLNKGEKYTEPGYTVFDSYNSGLSNDDVKVTSNVDTNKVGVYKIVYEVTNSRGITTSEVRTIIVMDSDISLSLDNTNYTNKDVAINIHVNDIYFDYMILPNETKIDTPSYSYKVSNNGTYKFRIYNKVGKGKEASISVHNIDKSVPTGSCSGTYGSGSSTVNITANDNVGIARYVINGKNYTTNKITIDGDMSSVTAIIYDKSGNSTTINCNLIKKEPPVITNVHVDGNFELRNYAHPGGTSFDYWINVPINNNKGLPLVVFLHGDGQISAPNSIPHVQFVKYVKDDYVGTPFILIAPVTKRASWTDGSIPTSLKGLIDSVVSQYNVNKNKIYIAGFSRGAIGTWHMVNAYPSFFAAATPISCCPQGANAQNFLHTKIKAISGTYDPKNEGYYNKCMTNFVNQINQAGGNAEKITHQGASHSTIGSVINYGDLFSWLLQQ